jgi:hypothetical protein
MPIQVTCPGCSAQLRAPDAMAGRTAKCRKCGAKIQIATFEANADSALEAQRKVAIAMRKLEEKVVDSDEPVTQSRMPQPQGLTRKKVLQFAGVAALVVLAIFGSSRETAKPTGPPSKVAAAPDFAEEHERVRSAIQESKDAQHAARLAEEEASKAKFAASLAKAEAETTIVKAKRAKESAELAVEKARAAIQNLKDMQERNTAAVAFLIQEKRTQEAQAKADKARKRQARSDAAQRRYAEAFFQADWEEQFRMQEGQILVARIDRGLAKFENYNAERKALVIKSLSTFSYDVILQSGRTGAELKEQILDKINK